MESISSAIVTAFTSKSIFECTFIALITRTVLEWKITAMKAEQRETVTLILKEERFEVDKQKLIDKSQYFAALLSANFLEYKQTEHVINYDISPILLQDFTVPLNIIGNKEAKILHGIISCEHNNREQYIHCWDGNDFFELTSFEYSPDIIERCSKTGKSLEGMQITGKGYDLYLCGGEYDIDSEIFAIKQIMYA